MQPSETGGDVKGEIRNDVQWAFSVPAFQFNGPQDNAVRWGVGECHILLTYGISKADTGLPDRTGLRTVALVDAVSGADINALSGWQDGWSYTSSDVTPYGSVATAQYSVVEFIVKRTSHDGARSRSLMIAPAMSFTPADHSGTFTWDGCLCNNGDPITLTITSSPG